MSQYHPLQSHALSRSADKIDWTIWRGTSFVHRIINQYVIPGRKYENVVSGFNDVGDSIDSAYENRDAVYVTFPLILEYDRIELIIRAHDKSGARAGAIVIHKYFPMVSGLFADTLGEELVSADFKELKVWLQANETAELTSDFYTYTIVLEHLRNPAVDLSIDGQYTFRNMYFYGDIDMLGYI